MKNIPLIDAIQLSHTVCKKPIQCKLAYATRENFLGRIVEGYDADAAEIAYATPKAAQALCDVQSKLSEQGMGLFIFDSYRPLRAVRDFNIWMQEPVVDPYELERKEVHYPYIEKNQLSLLGYLADGVSNHCFGDTIDLGLIDLQTNTLMDMGACFDYFDEISHATATEQVIGKQAYANRITLTTAMQAAGFLPYEKEFWHFTYQIRDIQEPLDFEIKK